MWYFLWFIHFKSFIDDKHGILFKLSITNPFLDVLVVVDVVEVEVVLVVVLVVVVVVGVVVVVVVLVVVEVVVEEVVLVVVCVTLYVVSSTQSTSLKHSSTLVLSPEQVAEPLDFMKALHLTGWHTLSDIARPVPHVTEQLGLSLQSDQETQGSVLHDSSSISSDPYSRVYKI